MVLDIMFPFSLYTTNLMLKRAYWDRFVQEHTLFWLSIKRLYVSHCVTVLIFLGTSHTLHANMYVMYCQVGMDLQRLLQGFQGK